MKKQIFISEEPIVPKVLEDWVWNPAAGAIVHFLGTVRNFNSGKKVLKIEYSAYPEMALKKLNQIVDESFSKWPILKCAVVHRVGTLCVGEIAVAVYVASPHRKEGFSASQYIINELKQRVPVWKREIYEDGS